MKTKEPAASKPGERRAERRAMSSVTRGVLVVLALVLVLSVVARAVLTGGEEPEPAAGAKSVQAEPDSFLPGGTQPPPPPTETPPEPEGGLEKALPYVTEGSFFAVIGFALGYASRKFLKAGLIVLAVFFVGLQGLSYAGVLSIDWERAVELLNRFVLNLKENQTVTEALAARLPSAGALLAAFFVGFRSG